MCSVHLCYRSAAWAKLAAMETIAASLAPFAKFPNVEEVSVFSKKLNPSLFVFFLIIIISRRLWES